jgi:hypothetical protein
VLASSFVLAWCIFQRKVQNESNMPNKRIFVSEKYRRFFSLMKYPTIIQNTKEKKFDKCLMTKKWLAHFVQSNLIPKRSLDLMTN